MTATKIQPGDDTHLSLLMAPHSLNFVTGADRAALLAYGRDVFAAAPALEAPAALLTKPALVGGGRFGVGVPERYVIEAAQRHHEQEGQREAMTAEQFADEERKRRTLWELIHGPLAAAPQAPAALDELGKIADIAACWGCDHPNETGDTELLRRVKWASRQLRAVAQAPAAASADERAAYIEFLTGKFPRSYGKEEAGRWWDQGHVSALAWQAARAVAAAPAAPDGVPAQGDPAALLQLAEVLESGRSLIDIERKEAAHALRLQATAAPAAPAVDAELLEVAQAIIKFNREHGSILAVHIDNLADLVDERAAQAAAKGAA